VSDASIDVSEVLGGMRLVLISDTHGLHDRIPQLPQGDILVHPGDFMNAGYDLREVISFNRWLGEHPLR
jgi:3',5'-cyclic AMP phosphodiesterase CpdA